MKVKMSNIMNYEEFYNSIINEKMPVKLAYKISKLSKEINSEMEFYRTKLNELLKEYAIMDENNQFKYTDDGTGILLQPGKEIECNTKIHELQELEIELSDITFEVEEFDDLNLSINQMNILMPFMI